MRAHGNRVQAARINLKSSALKAVKKHDLKAMAKLLDADPGLVLQQDEVGVCRTCLLVILVL